MNSQEKLATYGTQDKDKQDTQHNTVCVGHHYGNQTQITFIRQESSYKQLEVATNRTSWEEMHFSYQQFIN
jgi:hypothetical protein